jgi:hypothetical protein
MAVLLLAASSCRHRPTAIQVPVQYLSYDDAVRRPAKSTISGKRVVLKVENRFGEEPQIGQDASAGVPILAEPGELTRLVGSGFQREVGLRGAQLAAAGDAADVILAVGVTVVSVEEGARYTARIVAQIEASTPGGEVLASSILEGGSTHGGEDYNGDQVNMALNKALADLIARVFTNPSLMAALSRGGPPAQ